MDDLSTIRDSEGSQDCAQGNPDSLNEKAGTTIGNDYLDIA